MLKKRKSLINHKSPYFWLEISANFVTRMKPLNWGKLIIFCAQMGNKKMRYTQGVSQDLKVAYPKLYVKIAGACKKCPQKVQKVPVFEQV